LLAFAEGDGHESLPSLVCPFICGPICALGLWISPSPWLQSWWWVPLPLDIGLLCLPGIVGMAIFRMFRHQGSEEDKSSS
jgi:hypothetical protein